MDANVQLNKEEQINLARNEVNRMFNISEKCIMKYICNYYNIKPEDLFIDSSNNINEKDYPLILSVCEESEGQNTNPSQKKYISLSLEIVQHDFKTNIPQKYLEDDGLNYALGFIYHSVTTVFNAIISKNIKDDQISTLMDGSFHLEFNDETYTFYPIYIYPQKRYELMLKNSKDEIIAQLKKYASLIRENQATNEMKQEFEHIRVQYYKTDEILKKISYDANDALEEETKINEILKEHDRIGIVFKEITANQIKDDDKSIILDKTS
jgi:hypothetical protein